MVMFKIYNLITIIVYNNNIVTKKNHANGNVNITESFLNLIDQEETVSFNLIMMKSVSKWSIFVIILLLSWLKNFIFQMIIC